MGRLGQQLLRALLAAGIALGSLQAAVAKDDEDADSAAIQRDVLVLVRAVATDKNLQRRFGAELKVGVVYAGKQPKDESAQALAVFGALGSVTIGGLELQSAPLPWTDAEAFGPAVVDGEFDVIFVPSGLDAAAEAVPAVSREHKRTTITRHRPYVESGLGLGVELFEGKPRIVVNLDASKAEGSAYPSTLLRMADVIRDADRQ